MRSQKQEEYTPPYENAKLITLPNLLSLRLPLWDCN